MLWVDDADADTAPRWQVGQHLQFTRAWRAELEKEGADLHLLEKGEKRAVVPSERGPLVARPIATTDMKGET